MKLKLKKTLQNPFRPLYNLVTRHAYSSEPKNAREGRQPSGL